MTEPASPDAAESTPASNTPGATFSGSWINQTTTYEAQFTQPILSIPEDTIRLAFVRTRTTLDARRGWVAPGGIFVTLIVALVASDLPTVWLAIFVVASVVAGIWLLRDLLALWRHRDADPEEDFVRRLKGI